MNISKKCCNKQKFLILKEELKNISKEIKKLNLNYKNQQSRISKEKMGAWKTQEEHEFFKKHWLLHSKIRFLQFQFRHKLIAYSIIKGKQYEQVEHHVRQSNEPNWVFIQEIYDEIHA